MIFNTLNDSAERGELLLVDGGMCHWHLRRDGQLTIREIISTRKGAGYRMLRRLERVVGATSLFAKCPVHLEANSWYTRQNFHVERMEFLPGGSKVIHWRKHMKTKYQPNVPPVEIIYSSGGNARFAEIAIDAGMHTGSQLPETVYYKPYFVDQDWKNPNLERYTAECERFQPYLATVLDWTHDVKFSDVMNWCEAIAPHAKELIIIPKVPGTVAQIPAVVCDKPVRLGYSVPTRFAGTTVSIGEFGNRPVHLLGGSPERQMELTSRLNVVSVDINYTQKLASQQCAYWTPQSPFKSKANYFVTLKESDGGWMERDATYEAFRRSCHNVMQAWRNLKINRQQVGAQLALNLQEAVI